MKNILYLCSFVLLISSCETNQKESMASKDSTDMDAIVYPANLNKESPCKDGIYIARAHAYNNFIVDNQAYIVERNIQFVKSLETSFTNEKREERYKKLIDQTQNSIDSLKQLCSFNGNVEYKNAAIDLFQFYQDAWKEYKGLVDVKNKEERIRNYEQIKKHFNDVHSKKERKLEGRFVQAHTDFTNQYMLHVRNTPLHENLDSMLSSH